MNKNSIGHLLRTSWEYFAPPPPQSFRKEMVWNRPLGGHANRWLTDYYCGGQR